VGVSEERRLYEGPPHAWQAPVRGRTTSFLLFAFASWVVAVELFFVAGEVLIHGRVLPATARGFAVVGLLCLVGANVKTVALVLSRHANEALAGLLDILVGRLWLAHFWLNPLGVFSLGLFFLGAPPQPLFYGVAYGVLLWQTLSGLLAREALPLGARGKEAGRVARGAHRQGAVFVLLLVLAAGGFVDSLVP
jgi:hypothetical protein